jgi:imidazolonepropionase-like amidohydrolase
MHSFLRRAALGAVSLFAVAVPAQDELGLGKMWTFERPPLEYLKREYGFEAGEQWWNTLRLASLRFGRGCSASFISPQGLILTNHHCVRDGIAQVQGDNDWVRDGFVARDQEGEVRVPGLTVQQLIDMRDVTAEVVDGVRDSMSPEDAERRRESNRQRILAEVRAADATLDPQLVKLFQGGVWQLYRYRVFDDIRLVMAPQLQVSHFGGDPDNFVYPRYAIDFAFCRAYVDGKPADTSTCHFPWGDGPEEGDLVFLTGNPGGTQRLLTMSQLMFRRNARYPRVRELIDSRIDILREFAAKSAEAEKQLRTSILGLENAQKLYRGEHQALLSPAFINRKREAELAFQERAQKQGFGAEIAVWDQITELMQDKTDLEAPLNFHSAGGSTLMLRAFAVLDFAATGDEAKAKLARDTDCKRDEVQEAMFADHLRRARGRLLGGDGYVAAMLDDAQPKEAVERLLTRSSLADAKFLDELLAGGREAIEASDDAALVAARIVLPLARQNQARQATLDAKESALAGRDLHAAVERRSCRGLSVQRHRRAVAHRVPRPVRAQRRVRRPAPVRPARALAARGRPVRHAHADRLRLHGRRDRRQLRKSDHQHQGRVRWRAVRRQHRIAGQRVPVRRARRAQHLRAPAGDRRGAAQGLRRAGPVARDRAIGGCAGDGALGTERSTRTLAAMLLRCLLFLVILPVVSGAVAAQDLRAFTGARIEPVDGPAIADGVLLVRGTRIEAIGDRASVRVPGEAEVVDCTGLTILPGLVCSHSHIGAVAGADGSGPIQPEVRALDSINPRDPGIQKAQAGGITTANIMPGSGHLLSGQTVYVKLRDGRTVDDLLIRLADGRIAGGIKMANGTNPQRDPPFAGTRGKAAALMRAQLHRAREYQQKITAANGDADKVPERNFGLEALVEALDGKRIVHFHTHRQDDILTVLRLREEFGFRVVLHHVSEGGLVAPEIAAAKVPCSVIVIDSPGGKLEAAHLSLDTGAVLDRAGVLVGFHTDDGITDSRLFLRSPALAMRAGMERQKALAAVTIANAQMLDLQDRIGTLTAGKDADFVLLSGDPFSVYTRVLQTWVEGRKVFDFDDPKDRLMSMGGYGASDDQSMSMCCYGTQGGL